MKKNRAKPLEYVSDGISQLFSYRADYFSSPENRRATEETYGISVGDDARMVLVVGSGENVRPDEVALGTRQFRDDLEIIDFDTLRTLYLLSAEP